MIATKKLRNPPLAWTTPWKTGRFYQSYACYGTITTTNPGVNAFASPIIVPQDITIATLNCEVTSAAPAGNTMRLAMYRADPESGLPGVRMAQTANLAIDSTGNKSEAINTPVTAGLYWLAFGATAAAVFRAIGAQHLTWIAPSYPYASLSTIYGTILRVLGIGDELDDYGWPVEFWRDSTPGSLDLPAVGTVMPRVMVGV